MTTRSRILKVPVGASLLVADAIGGDVVVAETKVNVWEAVAVLVFGAVPVPIRAVKFFGTG